MHDEDSTTQAHAQDYAALEALGREGVAGTRWAGRPLIVLRETGSTNDEAREAGRAGAPHGYTVVADTQRAGRGRRGRSWYSPEGVNLYLSLLVRPSLEVQRSPMLALCAGLGVARACDRFVEGARVTVKWPNDVRIDGRKCAGVLVEGSIREGTLDSAVIGIGLNVHERHWPSALEGIATSLDEYAHAPLSRATVLLAVLAEVERCVDALLLGGSARATIVRALRERCDTIGARFVIDDEEVTGVDLDDDGSLVVQRCDGTLRSVRSGEVR
jgi:BirA family biotin operon repressor/biotin-[acetyl-CoA-carboxylase] ligase